VKADRERDEQREDEHQGEHGHVVVEAHSGRLARHLPDGASYAHPTHGGTAAVLGRDATLGRGAQRALPVGRRGGACRLGQLRGFLKLPLSSNAFS
jgi:hypothetical protein